MLMNHVWVGSINYTNGHMRYLYNILHNICVTVDIT